MGYDWNSLLEIVQDAIGPRLYSVIVRFFEEGVDLFSVGPGPWIEQVGQAPPGGKYR